MFSLNFLFTVLYAGTIWSKLLLVNGVDSVNLIAADNWGYIEKTSLSIELPKWGGFFLSSEVLKSYRKGSLAFHSVKCVEAFSLVQLHCNSSGWWAAIAHACRQCFTVSGDIQKTGKMYWRLCDFTCGLAFSVITNQVDVLIAALMQRN